MNTLLNFAVPVVLLGACYALILFFIGFIIEFIIDFFL